MAQLTKNSTIRELYATPVGHDALAKVLLQMNLSERWIKNPLLGRLKLCTLHRLTRRFLDDDFWDALLTLVNSEPDVPVAVRDDAPAWWKEAVFYQIYPRSFYDKNGDGIGDLAGILEKLPYLKELGVGALWLSPVYDSPDDDNGYDIRDYRKIQAAYGTMEEFDALLNAAHALDMRVVMDLVVNHTSDEHAWFQAALASPDSPYRDYYFFRPDTGSVPNNWTSFFSGSAWKRYPEQNVWAMHLFSKKQMDLNWDNPAVRRDVIDMINWWLDKGVDGFRMDVINYISKAPGLPDGNASIGRMMGFYGIEHYYYGPHLHAYLRQIHDEAFAPHGAFSVGETPGVGREMAKLLTGSTRGEIDMIFSFDHLETPGHVRFDDYRYDLNYYRDYIIDWTLHYGNACQMSLFYNNHDNPRMASKITRDSVHIRAVQTLLAVMQFTLKGTPFIFQGDEMGLSDYDFRSIDELSDVESKNLYAELRQTMSEAEAFAVIKAGTRDHARMPLPWNDAAKTLPSHLRQSPDPIIHDLYRRLIRLRTESRALIYGDFTLISRKKDSFVYRRSLGDEAFVIECNLSDRVKRSVWRKAARATLFFPDASDRLMQPYEARIWKVD